MVASGEWQLCKQGAQGIATLAVLMASTLGNTLDIHSSLLSEFAWKVLQSSTLMA